ncbi:MAG: hypothetical protein PHT07_22590 [Paludibacter sp.]|nr:hypothetical protein [Paludibacter sp.]
MKNKILLFVLILGCFYSCTPPKYYVMKYSQIKSMELDKSQVNYIPLEDELVTKSVVLDSTYSLLMNNRYMKLDNYITKLERSEVASSELYLAKTLSKISLLDYPGALKSLDKINDKRYALLKSLLTIDLKYENERLMGAFDFNKYLEKYQKLIDTHPDNMVLKKIVSIRMRYLRYNY